MNRKSIPFISTLIILVLAMPLYEATVKVALGSPTTTICVDPPNSTAAARKTFSININVSDVVDLYGWEFRLRWNSTLLDFDEVTEGTFLKQGGSTFFWPIINNTGGYILADCTLLGNVSGVNGNGTLATVKFYAEVQGESALGLYNTTLINSLEESINHTANNGTVTITPPPPVGGIWITPNKLELLAPYIKLASATSIMAVATVALVKHRKKKQ